MAIQIPAPFKFQKFSKRQRMVLNFWADGSPYKDCDGIIADGAIRSGKTVSMSLSYVMWAMYRYNHQNFIMCGKTVGSFNRNVLQPLSKMLESRGFEMVLRRTENMFLCRLNGVENSFYIFGGRDERSQDLVQGITAAGAFFDEVALMPESFVNQATGRCSVSGSKLWFNCNPESPHHWFYVNWLLQYRQKNLLYLHFTMEDNLSLDEHIKARYRSMYAGVFYSRYINGLWVTADGLVYDMFRKEDHILTKEPETEGDYYVSCDYGIQNATVFLLWRKERGTARWICLNEYYYSGREARLQKTVDQLVDGYEGMLAGIEPKRTIVDPSASALIVELRRRKHNVLPAQNDVIAGISATSLMLQRCQLAFMSRCVHTIEEFGLYVWDSKAASRGEDKPIKDNDHCLTGETLVYTLTGKKQIRDLVGKFGIVKSYDQKKKKTVWRFFHNVRKTQENAKIYRIMLSDGSFIRCTADHPILTENGFKPAISLKGGEKIISV